ncbi:EpsG family protein [Akkermansiaceae bacterium]|nr:EpsG family protein [Akkermansiaceae bacterium]
MIFITLLVLVISSVLALRVEYQPVRNRHVYSYYGFCLLLICVCGFRIGDEMPDFATYEAHYYGIDSVSNAFLLEPSFVFIVKIANLIQEDDPRILFVIYAILGVSLKFFAIKKLSKYIFFSVAIYISNYFILHEMIQIRTGVASGIILLSLVHVYKREKGKFILCILGASLFHYSAVIFLFQWFLKPNRFNAYYNVALIPFAYVIHFINFDLLKFAAQYLPLNGTKLVAYFDRFDLFSIDVFGIFILTRIILYLYFVIYAKRIKGYNKYFYLLIKSYGVGLFAYIALSVYPEVAVRLAQTLFAAEIIIIPTLILTFKDRRLSRLAVLSYGLLAFSFNVYFTTYFNYK